MSDNHERNGGAPRPMNRVVIKEELVELTGDFRRALILNQFLYWSHRTRDYDAFLKEEKERNPDLEIEPMHGWIYKKAEELAEELMLGCSVQTVLRHIDPLVEAGWLQRRHNPRYGWDRTFQYRPDIHAIQRDLYALGYVLDDYPLLIDLPDSANFQNGKRTSKTEIASSKTEDQTVKNGSAIPETTSQSTPETTAEKDRGASAPDSAPAPDEDLDPDELFSTCDHKDNGDEKHKSPSILEDPRASDPIGLGQLCAERQKEEAAKGRPPGWTVPGGAEPIPDAMVMAWVTANGLVPEQIPKKLLSQYRRAMASAVEGLSATEEQAAQAVRHVLTHSDYSWYTYSHPNVEKFKQDVQGVLLQILSGRLRPTEDGKIVDVVPDEVLAQGTGLKAILAARRLKEQEMQKRGEPIPKGLFG